MLFFNRIFKTTEPRDRRRNVRKFVVARFLNWAFTRKPWRRLRVAAFLFQTQDFDVLLPVIESLIARNIQVRVLLHEAVIKASPRIVSTLQKHGIGYQVAETQDLERAGQLLGVSAMLTAADTNASPHLHGFAMVDFARRFHIRTFTMQHGFENIGLTYYDCEFSPDTVDFASDVIFTWGDRLHEAVPAHIRRRIVPVGNPKSFLAVQSATARLPDFGSPLIAIFENLHWTRYTADYRNKFLQDLRATAQHFPHVHFLIKPHHAGQWLTSQTENPLSDLSNVMIADPRDPQWEPYTAPALMAMAQGVITTPSTTAADAAHMGKPVAVAAYGLGLDSYKPLDLLSSRADWIGFVNDALDVHTRAAKLAQGDDFLNANFIRGDAANRIAEYVENST